MEKSRAGQSPPWPLAPLSGLHSLGCTHWYQAVSVCGGGGKGGDSKLPPSQSPYSVPPSLSCSSTSRCVYVFRHLHLPFPQAFAGPQNKEGEQEGLRVTHSGSADHRGPGLFVLVNWPAVTCLVWGCRIKTVFIFEFGAVRAEKKDLRLR